MDKKSYWYMDNWNGSIHYFSTLRAAKAAAKKETGVSVFIHNNVGKSTVVAEASGYCLP